MNGTVILGIGNILMKDDGVGVHVIRELEKENLPSAIELVDGGTSTLDTLTYFTSYRRLVIIDSLKAGYAPGTIYKIHPDEINNYKKENLSIHDVQILDVIKMANMLGYSPEVIVFGIEPEEILFDLEMSPIIKAILPDVIACIKEYLGLIP